MTSTTGAPKSSESKPERPYKRRYRSVSKRRRIVEQSLAPGANVKRVAEENGVRASQLFKWPRQYREGGLGRIASEPAMLPVRVTKAKKTRAKAFKHKAVSATPKEHSGTIRIEFAHCSLVIDGIIAPATLNAIIERLVVYNGSTPIWSSGTSGNGSAQLLLSDTGSYVQVLGTLVPGYPIKEYIRFGGQVIAVENQ